MASTKHVPEEHLQLCEGCGYILEGLPADARCPECGKPAIESTDPQSRRAPKWELARSPLTFLQTSVQVLFRPSHFFRHLATRRKSRWSTIFSVLWLSLAAAMFAAAGAWHAQWLESRRVGSALMMVPQWLIITYAFLVVFAHPLILVAMVVLNRVVARLTAWEAAYRGLRLPRKAVQRALDYHSVHLTPVALLALVTVVGYRLLLDRGIATASHDEVYVWTLCGEVILSAGYLFFTYWAAMRNMLFANS